MKKRMLSILLVFCMIFSMMPVSASAAADSSTLMQISSATQEKLGLSDSDVQRYEGYYAIRNAADLFAYGELLAGTYDPVNAILLHDIFLKWGTMWTPLRMHGGVFEGNGKTIAGIQVNMPDAEAVGFFSYVANGTIRNLTIGSSDGTPSSIIGKVAVGAIAGQIAGSTTIENCAAKDVKLKAQTDDPLSYIGGLVGHATSLDGVKRSVIENSYFGGTVTVYNSSTGNVGCIIGDHAHVTVSNCTWLADHAKICDHDSNLVAVVNRGTGDRYDTTYEDFQGELLSGTGDSHTHRSVTTTSLTATCEYGGYDSYSYCLVCDAILAGNKNQTEAHHEYAGGTCATEARCTICGAAGQKTNDHEYVGGNCTTEARCTICGGAGQKKPDLHSWSYGKCEWCSKPCNHSYDSNSMCTICRATCPHQKYENGTCKECGNSGILARFDIGGSGMGLRVQERVKNSSDNTYTTYPRELVKKTEENDGIQLVLIEPGKIYAFILEIDDAQKPGGFVSIYVDGIPTVMNLNTSYHSDGDTVFSICDHSDTEGTKCNACGKQLHTCTPGDTWTYNGTRHWRVCADASCGLVMDYETHTISSDTGRCVGCNRSCEHVWNDHNTCTKCGYVCEHYFLYFPPYSDGTLCEICPFKCEHNWENGHCSMCNYDCVHSIVDGICEICGVPCPHKFVNSVCTACGAECTHTWENGHCGTCDLTCSHSIVDGICEICGAPCPHEFVNSICTVCGAPCVHNFATGECPSCGIPCPHNYEITLQHGPFCTAEGLANYRCTDCGNEYSEILPSLGGHKYNYTVTDMIHEGVCETCENRTSGFHEYSETYTAETCTEDAYFTYTCDDCGYSYTRTSTAKLGHSGGEATCKELAVCERCGEGYGEIGDHVGGEATCTEQAICDVCGEGYGELKRHESDLDDSDCTTPVRCSVCGAVTKEANATHTWGEDNFCSNENCQQTKGFTFTFTYGDDVLFVRNVHTGNFYTFEDFEARDGLTLVGWVANEDADEDGEPDFYPIGDYTYVEGDLRFNAVYKLVYTVRFITYDIWEGSYTESFNPIMGEANQTVTLWDDASPYFKFLGWAMEEGGEVVYEANEEITLTQNLTLYGVIRPYRATFELGEGAVWNDENGNPITVLEGNYSGEWIEIRKFPTRTGYIFKGFMDQTDWLWEPWQDEDTGEWVVDFYFDRADLEMTAVWEECTEYNDNGFCTICGGYEPAELAGDYYEISNAGQLYWFAKQVNSGNRAINGKLTANIVVNENVLKADGTLNGDGSGFLPWTPMGNFKTSYTGTFDGNGKTVSGLYVNENTNYVGLFGNSSGTVKHVGVVDSYLSGDEYVGGVAGANSGLGTVENCYNTGSISGSDGFVGGVVGANYSSVESCHNTGSVICSGSSYVGGVVGCCQDGSNTITGCYNTGSVSGTVGAGGVVCSTDGTVTNCYNEGSVICSGSGYVGGVAGANDGGTITNCYNAGNLRGRGDVGGVVGFNDDMIHIYIGTVANCYYDSDIYSGNAIGYDSGAATAVLGKTTEQFASGEVAYLLSRGFTLDEGEGAVNYPGDVWGQNIDGEGETDAYPVFSDAKVYEVTNCTGETAGYSNTDEDTGHSFGEDGKCTICGVSNHTHTPDDRGQTCKGFWCTDCEEWYGDADPNAHTFVDGFCADCGEPEPEVPVEPAELAIIKQPVSVTGTIGETVSVTVVATGEGLTYQWYIRNDGGSWSRSSTTTATYEVVMNKSRANRELYCIITDANGNTLKTDVVSMTGQPNEELKILTQPTNAEAKLGENYCVEVIAQGDGLTYTWYWRNKGQERWNISGVKDNTYDDVMNASRAGREVYCVITDAWGNSVTTDTVTLIGLPQVDLAIVTQPNDASAKLDERFCVTVEAQGEGLTYTWYWRNKGQERWNVSGVKDNTYDDVMTRARHNREVYCVITDAFGNTVTSDIALITGEATMKLEITQQPTDAEAKLNQMYCVTVEAVGEDIHYQWYFKNKGSEQWSASSVKDNTYDDIMISTRAGREVYCVITDAWGNSVTTDTVTLVAIPDVQLAITAQPEDESVKMDEMFCVTVEAQGDGLKYQWYWRQVGSENWNVSGQRDNTYDDVMTKGRNNREVYCVITDAWGDSVETNVVTITAIPTETLAIVTQPTDASAAMGDNYCVTVEAVGDGLSYTWYFKNAGTNTWSKSGVTDNTYDDVMTKARAGRQVYCVITDAFGNQVTTEIVTLICTDIPQAIAMN